MSDLDDFNADFQDDSARNRRIFFWLIGGVTGAAIVGIALCGGLVWLAVERVGEIPLLGDFAAAELPPAVDESIEEKRAWAHSAFTDQPPFVVDRRPIETLFRRVTEACRADDAVAFQQLVDADLYWRSMKESGLIRSLTRGEDRRYPQEILATIEVPALYNRMYVHAVTPGRSPDEAVAYVFAWEDGWIAETRWWLVKREASWRVYDWESLQVGNRFSRRHAAYFAEIAGTNNHLAASTAVEKADEALAEDRFHDASQELRRAAAASVPELFQAEHRLELAFGWARAGLSLDERRTYRGATPDELQHAPGLLLGWAMTETAFGNYERGLELIDRYEQAVGGGPNVDRTRGDALFAMGRFDEAADCYVRLLEVPTENVSLLADIARRLPADRLDALTAAIGRQREPVAVSYDVAQTVGDLPKVLAAIEKYLNERHADSGVLDLVRGDRLSAEEAIDDASEAYIAAYEKLPPFDEHSEEPLAATRAEAVSRLVRMHCAADRVADAYDLAPDKRQAFADIMSCIFEFGLTAEDIAHVVERHLQNFPDDPAALARASTIAMRNGEHERAVKLILKAASNQQGEDELSYGVQAVSTLIDAGRIDEAATWVREHPADLFAFDELAEYLNDTGEWTVLLDVAEAIVADSGSDRQILAVQKATALAALDRYEEAESLLASAYGQIEEDWLRAALLDRCHEIAVTAGRRPAQIAKSIGADAYRQLVAAALQKRDFEAAVRLEQNWKRQGGTAIDLLPTTTQRLWTLHDYDAIVTAVRGVGAENATALEMGPAVLDRYVRSLIRTGEFEVARRAARRAYESTADATLLAVACIASGDWSAAEEAVFVLDDYGRSRLYADEDAGPLLAAEPAAAFRKKLRREITDLAGMTRGILLLRDPIEGDGNVLAQRLQEQFDAGKGVQVEPIDLRSSANEVHLLVRGREASWIVTFGQDRYVPESETTGPEDDVLAEALDGHAAWVAVDRCAGTPLAEPDAYPVLAAVAVMASDAEPVAVDLFAGDGIYLLPWSEELPASMRDKGFVASNVDRAELWQLYREPAEEDRTSGRGLPLRELAASFAKRRPGEAFVAEGVLRFPHGQLPVQLKVEQVVSYPYLIEAIGTLESRLPGALDEALGLREDDRITIGGENLRDWRRATPIQQAAPTDE